MTPVTLVCSREEGRKIVFFRRTCQGRGVFDRSEGNEPGIKGRFWYLREETGMIGNEEVPSVVWPIVMRSEEDLKTYGMCQGRKSLGGRGRGGKRRGLEPLAFVIFGGCEKRRYVGESDPGLRRILLSKLARSLHPCNGLGPGC